VNSARPLFLKKRKIKEKEKDLNGLGPVHNEADPNARIWPRSKKKHIRRGPLGFGILHQEPQSISKIIKALPPFLSL
jgi:hypothetical protein